MKKSVIIFLLLVIPFVTESCKKAPQKSVVKKNQPSKKPPVKPITKNQIPEVDTFIHTGAEQIDLYLPDLQGKSVAMVVNHTSLVGKTHLVDTLLGLGVNIRKIFAPEHGFRGEADAGEKVNNGLDEKTKLPLISLYGKNKKPLPEQIADIDIVVFDIQDVGARFYTYISTMHYVMEACAENAKKVLILDRPNPNGSYADGPMLDLKYKSFVGMHPIPVVHGLTVCELANMINGEGWLANKLHCDLKVIKAKNYEHRKSYILPVRPSPNLPNQQSVLLYPSVCFFEGTKVSVARGTDFPFQAIGGTDPALGTFQFTPKSTFGAKEPMYKDKICYGLDLRTEKITGLSLTHLIEFYQKSKLQDKFFNSYFDTLAGTDMLRKQILAGMTESQIRASWQPELEKYKLLRKKYLLYP
jgi:uncharacterized protein YbbC (DUF1343 family)